MLLAVFIFIEYTPENKPMQVRGKVFGGGDQAAGRAEWETERLADPTTGRIPPNARRDELSFARTLPVLNNTNLSSGRLSSIYTYRGPSNVGGRTRALAIDVSNENIILAGSVNGGIWRSVDSGLTWNRSWGLNVNQAITWISQDKRAGHTNTWYCSTGEAIGASSSGAGAYYLGNGIYKSTDGGLTWSVLSFTSSSTPHTFDDVFDLIYKVVPSQHVPNVNFVYAASYGAIFLSNDGGLSWNLQKGTQSGSAYSYYTDVDVTTTGIAYATLSSDGPDKGIWRRDLANAWTKISPPGWDTGTVNRVVIGINPSNENQVYFLGETPFMGKLTTNYKGDPEWTSLWKYTYVSGNGSGAGGQWQDLSANIPYDSSQMGNFNSQGGYNLMVCVHPTDSNIVFIGGTNLYRSTDGFLSDSNITHIGGYNPGSTIPYYVNYPNHHSDQHNMVFLPSNPDIVYQANDGGICRSTDIKANQVVWQDLNTGYNTTQFYTVALDHGTPGNDIILGGTQDNGTWFTNTQNSSAPWTQPGRGDGAYCAVDSGHGYFYTSRQLGRLMKSTLDANGNTIAYNRIDPISPDSIEYMFINPFVMDPNSNDILYWAANNRIWRNDSLTSIPLSGNWDSISTGWFLLPDSVTYSGARVSSFGISKNPANRLYVGTNKSFVYRIDSANTSTPVMTEITDGVNFPPNSNINCIGVDPNNADHLIVVFSNYRIYSLFYSYDGGVTWTKGAGNLEGPTQSGPSLRWVSIIPTANGNVYLVGSSTGLYGTNNLNGLNTIWTQLAPNEIGNLVVDMIDFRVSDGRVAIATHGGGMFTTTISDTLFTGISTVPSNLIDIKIYPNPSNGVLFVESNGTTNTASQVKIYDSNGKLVVSRTIKLSSGSSSRYRFDATYLKPGFYYFSLEYNGDVTTKKVLITE
jgi:hypothetical protein